MSRDDVRNVLFAALALVASSAGCQLDADHFGTRYRCDESGACPADYACMSSGFCEPVSGGVAGAQECGTTNVLKDDFEDAEDNRQWNVGGYGSSATEADGLLTIEIQPDIPGAVGVYHTRRRYLFRSSSVAVEASSLDPALPIFAELEIEADGSTQASIRMVNGDLRFVYELNDQEHVIAAVPYSETDHRWWRLREDAGVLLWETSPDGDAWEVQGRTSSTPFSTLVVVELEVRTTEVQTVPMQVQFDNFNAGSEGDAWCPATVLRDDFDDGLLGNNWGWWESNDCTLFERDGKLVFEHEGNGGGDCGYYSLSLYDLHDSSVTVEAPQVTEKDIYVSLVLDMPSNTELLIERRQNESGYELGCRKRVEGQSSEACAIPYDEVAHRWWRIRSEDDLVHWETSPDGLTWKVEATHGSSEMPLEETEIVLSSWTESTDEPGEIVFDNLNIE